MANECEADYELLPGIDDDDVKGPPEISLHLSDQQTSQLTNLIQSFKDTVFSEKLGHTDLIQHAIKLKDEKPCVSKSFRLPDSLKDQVARQIEKMLADGVIEESDSDFRSPLLAIKKPNNQGIRIVADLRKINERSTNLDQYPASNPMEILDRCTAAKYISIIDLNQAFFQVSLAPESRKYTAFEANGKLFQYRVTPMGAQGSTKTFQRLADRILKGAEKYAAAHVDDFVIFSESWDDHLKHLSDILQRLQDAGLTAKLAKCQFAKPSIKCLGFVLENGFMKPDYEKVRAIKEFETPKTKRHVRAFLGVTGFFRKMIPQYSEKAFTLTELTRKNAPEKVIWGEKEERAFQQLKADLCKEPCLKPPEPNKPYSLYCDASANAIASVLMQCDAQGISHPVAYFSRKILPRERAFSTVEREALSIINALTHFESYIYGVPITLYSDHHCLQYLKSFSNSNPRLTRWSLILDRFRADIKYVPGPQNTASDGLSRAYTDTSIADNMGPSSLTQTQ